MKKNKNTDTEDKKRREQFEKEALIKSKKWFDSLPTVIVCHERGCEDPYGRGYDCHVCLKR